MAPRILVVDDTQAIRRSVRLRIENETDWEICGEAENGREAVERVQDLHPDVVLLDLSMPVMNGLDAARHIKAIAPHTHILMFTLHTYPQLLDEARKAGIAEVVSKSGATGPDLLHALRSLLAS
jgi:two-component system, NarL family, nitrate/nitrite response regulator NarL